MPSGAGPGGGVLFSIVGMNGEGDDPSLFSASPGAANLACLRLSAAAVRPTTKTAVPAVHFQAWRVLRDCTGAAGIGFRRRSLILLSLAIHPSSPSRRVEGPGA